MTTEGITYIKLDLQTSQHITLYNSVFTYITVHLHILQCIYIILHSMYTYIQSQLHTHTLHAPITNHNNHMSRRTTVNIGSEHRMVMGSVTLHTRAERRKLLNKNTQNKILPSNYWNEEEHVSTRTETQVHSTRRTVRHRQSK